MSASASSTKLKEATQSMLDKNLGRRLSQESIRFGHRSWSIAREARPGPMPIDHLRAGQDSMVRCHEGCIEQLPPFRRQMGARMLSKALH